MKWWRVKQCLVSEVLCCANQRMGTWEIAQAPVSVPHQRFHHKDKHTSYWNGNHHHLSEIYSLNGYKRQMIHPTIQSTVHVKYLQKLHKEQNHNWWLTQSSQLSIIQTHILLLGFLLGCSVLVKTAILGNKSIYQYYDL